MTKSGVPLMQIQDNKPDNSPQYGTTGFAKLPFWDLAFRPMFLLASVFSVLSLLVWIASINGLIVYSGSLHLPVLLWHVHEMIFGFALAIAVGFLLTAVQTWTGQRSLHGWGLILLTACWLIARFAFWKNQAEWVLVGVAAQLGWWLIAIVSFARLVIKAQQNRQMIFIALLSFIAVFNAAFLYSAWLGHSELALHLARTAILFFTVIISVLAGRVIPFFTNRGAAHIFQPRGINIQTRSGLDIAILIITLLAAVVYFIRFIVELSVVPAGLFISAGLIHLYRFAHWKTHLTFSVPLLWSLHLSYLALALGLIGLGLSYFFIELRFADALHIITVGAIGAMILAMMARVSLGHTGRALTPHWLISFAFAFILIAVVVRFVLVLLLMHLWAWNLSAILWSVSFLLFALIYFPVLIRARL